jgi:carbon monoxide dehydrogenase subunit G
MIRLEESIVVERPVEEVFAYTTDPAKVPEWQSSALEASADGPLRPGTTLTEVRKFLGRRIVSRLEVEQHEPPRKFAGRVTTGPVQFRFEQTTEPANSGTRVSVLVEGEPGGFFRLAEPLVERALRRELQTNSATLKDILEAGG